MKKKLIPCIMTSSRQSLRIAFPIILLTIVIFLPVSVLSASWYIKPSNEIPLRRGQGTDYKILAVLPDGAEVTIVEENDPWVRVTSEDGKDGWILKRYLTQDKPLHEIVDALQQENDTLKEEITALQQKNTGLSNMHTSLQQTLEKSSNELSETQANYDKLKEDTADVMALKNELDQSKHVISTQLQELAAVSAGYKQLKSSRNIQWFLAGGATLIVGCIIGMILAKSRKRKSSLY